MHTGTQRKNVIKPINRFADGCPAREQGRRSFPYSIVIPMQREVSTDMIKEQRENRCIKDRCPPVLSARPLLSG